MIFLRNDLVDCPTPGSNEAKQTFLTTMQISKK